MAVRADRAGEDAEFLEVNNGCRLFNIPEHVRSASAADGGTALDILRGQIFRLNLVGSRILELAKQGNTELQIAEKLAGEFEIDRARAKADLCEFLQTLEKLHLITIEDGNPLS